jgi:catechol-2,3-dioxygenase
VLLVKDPVFSKEFYVEAVGLSVKSETDSSVELDAGGVSLVLKVSFPVVTTSYNITCASQHIFITFLQ